MQPDNNDTSAIAQFPLGYIFNVECSVAVCLVVAALVAIVVFRRNYNVHDIEQGPRKFDRRLVVRGPWAVVAVANIHSRMLPLVLPMLPNF